MSDRPEVVGSTPTVALPVGSFHQDVWLPDRPTVALPTPSRLRNLPMVIVTREGGSFDLLCNVVYLHGRNQCPYPQPKSESGEVFFYVI